MNYETLIVGSLETNCYLVYCQDTLESAIVDPGAEPQKIFNLLEEKKLNPVLIINTHGHVDHVGANKDMKEKFDIPLCIHSSDSSMLNHVLQSGLSFFLGSKPSPKPDRFFTEGEEIKIGTQSLKVLHTPGHSPGSVCLLGSGFILSGDLLFCGGVGRTDLPGGSWTELENSIKSRIFTLPEETIVLPGHGPSTSVGVEKSTNPFIR
ncbi:MBL fold metallo-hydrolase [Acidobacteriota bacterium]